MKISDAIRAVNDECDDEISGSKKSGYERLMVQRLESEWTEIDKELPAIVAQCAKGNVPDGTYLAPWIYIMARLVFRLGMRVQRKLDHPNEPTTTFWQGGHVKH